MKAAEVGDLEADLRRAREENAELRKRLNEVSSLEAAKKKADLRVEQLEQKVRAIADSCVHSARTEDTCRWTTLFKKRSHRKRMS